MDRKLSKESAKGLGKRLGKESYKGLGKAAIESTMYISHRSAAEMYGVSALDLILANSPGITQQDDLTDVSFTGHARRRWTKGMRMYSSENIPAKGSILLYRGQAVASPELLFLQMAKKLDIQRLILLGLQICAHPPGKPSEALSTAKKIRDFIDNASGCHGHNRAARAAQYLADGSGSALESLAFMVITLPPALGGYGLRGGVFNHEVILDKAAQKQLGQDRCFVDIFFKKAAVAVEYQSLSYHATAAEQGKDFIRASLLERMGIGVMQLSTIQLYNRDACNVFVHNLAKRLGHRMQIRASGFEDMHTKLRALLPTSSGIA